MNKPFYFFPLFLFLISCTSKVEHTTVLTHYDFKEMTEYFLKSELREISGLTFHNGRIHAHNDEKGIVYILNESGNIMDQFYPGIRPLRKDFEGIAAVGNDFYMVTSVGVLYKFTKTDSVNSSYEEIKTPLNEKYDVEGLCYDQETNSLLLACKEYPKKNERNVRSVFTFDISSGKLVNKPRFIISIEELKEKYGLDNFSPSGIDKHNDGNFYILSSDQKAIAVYSPDGQLIEASRLPSKHMQPEGIAFLSDNSMVISDEGGKDDAELTIYRYKSQYK